MTVRNEATFLDHGGRRWLWISLLSAVGLSLYYFYDDTTVVAYGGSNTGLVYGVIGTIIILVLMYLGIRKRSYASGVGSLKGWVSAHVYLGLLTLLLIPLHAGFRFGWDVHTLAFVLLSIVVLSGVLGVVLYQLVPVRLTKHETKLQANKIDQEITLLFSEMYALVKDRSDALVALYQKEIASLKETKSKGWSLVFRGIGGDLIARRSAHLSKHVPNIPVEDQQAFQSLSQLLLKKTQLEIHLLNQMRLRNAMQAWLYVHVPISVVMLVTIIIHVWSVFYY